MHQTDASPWKNRLRQERIERNWRQRELAERLGTTVVTVTRWERGSHQPSAYFRVKLCALFGKSAEELGLILPPLPQAVSTSTQSNPPTSPITHLWHVPYPRNPFFTGRQELLETLREELHQEHATALTQSWAISGLGGIGKTQIALEYVYQYRHAYTSIFWTNAASEESLLADMIHIADLLQLPEREEHHQKKLLTAVKRWFTTHQNWLWVLDNADDITMVQQFFPLELPGSILLTSRAQALGTLARRIDVETMGMAEATLFLLRRAGLLAEQAPLATVSEDVLARAEALVIALGFLPLALDQAGAYIEEIGCGLAQYLELYTQHHKELLNRRGKMSTDHPEPIMTTWSLSFQKVEEANPAAADLLRLFAFLAPDRIPEEFLTEGAQHWPPLLKEAVTNGLAFQQMLAELLKFSLVKRLANEHLLSLHRLVQAVQKISLEPEEQYQWAERVVRAMHLVFPQDAQLDVAAWPRCLRYLEQAQACDTLIQQYQLTFIEATNVLNRTGLYLREQASYSLAETLFQRALTIREQQDGPEHLNITPCANLLAELYKRLGRYTQAEALFQRALAIRQQQLGPEHAETATSLNNLGVVCKELGKYEQAEQLLQQGLVIWEKELGPEHVRVAMALNNLALVYMDQEHYARAEALHQRAAAIRQKQLGLMHPQTAASLNNLAIVAYEQGNYEQAEQLYQQTLAIEEQFFGPEHLQLAGARHNLAELYQQMGKYELAEPLYQRALTAWTRELGPAHPLNAYALQGLGKLYRNQGKYELALPLLRRALEIREQALSPTHVEIADIRHELAVLLQLQGRHEEACTLAQLALANRIQTIGSTNPRTIETRTHLLALLHILGREEEAAQLEKAEVRH